MARIMLTDRYWEQVKTTLKAHGCYISKNSRNVMEAILWKLRTGATWRDIPEELCPWKTAFTRFNRWARKGLWERFFLTYEEMLIKSGYSSTELMLERISIRVELHMLTSEQLEDLEEVLQPRYISQPMPMETRLILKSLGVTSATSKLHQHSLKQ